MPLVRPFRALRYSREAIEDPALVVAPPYDVIDETTRRRLLARHPKNVVRLEVPHEEPGDEPEDRYRRVARTLAEWRTDGTLRKDPRPAVYVAEQTYRLPGTAIERTQRGIFLRLALEPYGPDGVRAHERTMTGPREDRYKLLRATGVNTSPVVALFGDPDGTAAAALAEVVATTPEVDLVDDEGTRHRLWVTIADGAPEGAATRLLAAAGAGPVTIADGHHRYETALRYRDERRMSRSCEETPAFDYLLVLLLPAEQRLSVLATHRIVRGLADAEIEGLRDGLAGVFEVEPADPAALREAFGPAATEGGAATLGGRLGLWTRSGGAILRVRRDAAEGLLPAGGAALRSLDVTLLGAVLERFAGIDGAAVAAGRLGYTKSVDEAIAAVHGAIDGAAVAVLLDPTPVEAMLAAAAEGDVLPQKSTYFFPKALTGLVLNPHEW